MRVSISTGDNGESKANQKPTPLVEIRSMILDCFAAAVYAALGNASPPSSKLSDLGGSLWLAG